MEYGAGRRRRALRRLRYDALRTGGVNAKRMAGSGWAQLAFRRRVLWRQPLAVVQEYRLPVQSGAENAAVGSVFLGIPQSTPVGERH
ncbi:hypothetical protein D3C81_1171010 [compost metagenome]